MRFEDDTEFSYGQFVKAKTSKNVATWTAGADRQFGSSPLGSQVLALLRDGSRSQRTLSDVILRDPVFVATHGIEDLAAQTGISASTISRYVRDLGLANYAEFRNQVAETVHALIAPVTKLSAQLATGNSARGTAEASIQSAVHNLEALRDPNTAEALRRVSAQIESARYVWVMGFGISAHLAAILTLGLQPYREGVVNVVQYGGTESSAVRLMSAGEGDVVIAIAFPRYSGDITDLVQAAKMSGARIVALTDSNAAPLAQHADELLLAPAQHPVLSSSALPGLALIEALVAEFLLSNPQHAGRAAKLAAALARYLAPSG